MFTYIDDTIRKRLLREDKLVRLDASGTPYPANRFPAPGERALELLGPVPLPMVVDKAEHTPLWYASVRHTELAEVEALAGRLREEGGQRLFAGLANAMAVNSVLVFGQPTAASRPLVRVHSNCLTGDVFGSLRCECGPQLDAAIERFAVETNGGLLVYMAGHEGRGIGLWAKAATYVLQDAGEDTYSANRSVGLPEDSRDFGDAAILIRYFLGSRPIRLLTNNQKKSRTSSAPESRTSKSRNTLRASAIGMQAISGPNASGAIAWMRATSRSRGFGATSAALTP